MQGRDHRVADQLGLERQMGGDLVALTVEADAEKADIGHSPHQPIKRAVAVTGLAHGFFLGRSNVKAPVPIATGRASSSSVAITRTKATERVTWWHSARAVTA
jgi:hypothetical protein